MKIAVLIQDQYRLDDHPALNRALSMLQSGEAREALVFTHLQEQSNFPSDPGSPFLPPLCGPFRSRIRNEAIESLQQKLDPLGISTRIFSQSTPNEIWNSLHDQKIDRVFCSANHQNDPFWASALSASNIPVETFFSNHLFSKWPVPHERFPKVFTDFKNQLNRSMILPIERSLSLLLKESEKNSISTFSHDPRSSVPFDGSEETALNRLHHYFFATENLKNYKLTRNQMIGLDYSSKFSIFLSVGSLSARRIWAEITRHESLFGPSEGSEWMRFELLWREFFYWLSLKHGSSFYRLEGIQNKSNAHVSNRQGFQNWIDGNTGSSLVDACMKELKTTGYLSNRGRQNVASYLVHTVQVPWHWGARYFEWILIDYDASQNYGNWSYLAGVGSDPRSFGNNPPRYFNIEKQAEDYDPQNHYRQLWNRID